MNSRYSVLLGALATTMVVAPAHAIQFDGFFTVGATRSNDKNGNVYIGSLGDRGITHDITFETDTRFGLQITSEIANNASVVAQILGKGTKSNFNAVVEWAYVDYEFNKHVSMHAGKIKQPVYLVNDYVEVGYAYPWIRPPSEVYYLNNPLNTVNGAELLFTFPMGKGQLTFQPYIGSNREDIPNTNGTGYFEAEGIAGIDIKYAAPGFLIHASDFHCRTVNTHGGFSTLAPALNPGGPAPTVDVNLEGSGKCNVASTGFNLDMANVVVYAEYQKRTTTDALSRPFGDTKAWYTTVGYRMGKWLPHLTFASIDGKSSTYYDPTNNAGAVTVAGVPPGYTFTPGADTFNFPIPIQTSVTAGLRYEVNDSAALKMEYSVVDVSKDPTDLANANQGFNFGLFNTSFSTPPPTDKVGIASIALDVIF